METIFHTTYYSYRNCNLPNGISFSPSGNPLLGAGCILFSTFGGMTSPEPPSRPALYIESQGHGNRGVITLSQPFGGHGITYWPHNSLAETPSSTGTNEDDAYVLQWVDKTELASSSASLWAQRLNLNPSASVKIFESYAEAIAPHGAYVFSKFVCEHACPTLHEGNALAPWRQRGQPVGGTVIGDYHNHPAWYWSHLYGPDNAAGFAYFDYSCFSESCRLINTYSHNPFWSDLTVYGGGGTGGGGPCMTPPCPLTSPKSLATSQQYPSELRWDFNSLDGITVTGDDLLDASVRAIPDAEWGSRNGTSVLRIEGSGTVYITLSGQLRVDKRDQLSLRLRRTVSRGRDLIAEWGTGTPERREDRQGQTVQVSQSATGWEIRTIALNAFASWRLVRNGQQIRLRLDLDPVNRETLELDFVVLDR